MERFAKNSTLGINTVLASAVIILSGCSSVKGFFAADTTRPRQMPISNPFDVYSHEDAKNHNVILRTKKGDRSVEVELPGDHGQMSDFVVPVSPAFREDSRGPASAGAMSDPTYDERFKEKIPSASDREITSSFPQGIAQLPGGENGDAERNRRDIETGLGVLPSEDSTPAADRSYLAAVDHIKQLYKSARYEAAIMEIDELVRVYPTDAKLYQMRGTLLDRMGRSELALKSWNQALRLDSSNQSLRRFIERKQEKRGVAAQ